MLPQLWFGKEWSLNMPYKNIVFVKLEKRLLNDPRWWTMSTYSQLIYIKLMLLAAETYNKIPLNEVVLIKSMRLSLGLNKFRNYLNEILVNFPKLKKNKHFMYFDEFETKTNWVNPKELSGNSQVFPKLVVDKEKEKEEDKEIEKEKKENLVDNFSFKKKNRKQTTLKDVAVLSVKNDDLGRN